MTLEEAVFLLYRLNRDQSSGHEKPHKPAMLLAVMDLVELREVDTNRVPPSGRLRELFSSYFEIVRQGNDRNTPENPFYYLCNEPFWSHYPRRPDGPQSWAGLQRLVEYAVIDPGLFALMANPLDRELLRESIFSRFFPQHREALRLVVRENGAATGQPEPEVAEEPPGRDAAFRRVVTDVYDYRCAACGLRVQIETITLVEAAHLIPWAKSHNDNPRNGMALCRNHHYAMDARLIAPCPEMKWRVSSRLDDRRDGEKDLVRLGGRSILLPNREQFYPDPAGLAWRCERLL